MNLYAYHSTDGEIREIAVDSHVEEFELFKIAKKVFDVEIEPGSIKQRWQTTILNRRKQHDRQVLYSYPITIGKVKHEG